MDINYTDLFDRAARISHASIALADETGELTYGAVTVLSNRIANALIAQGCAPSFRFALLTPNTSLAMVAMLAGLRAGGAWCNINLRNAPATNIDILARGECEVLFFHSSTAPVIGEFRAGVKSLRLAICIDREIEGFSSLESFARGASEAPVNVRLGPGAVGFQGSTGGTTGAPKITQGGPGFLAWNTIGFMTALPFDRPPVNIALAPITHAGGIVAMATLAMGGTVVLMGSADLERLLSLIEHWRGLVPVPAADGDLHADEPPEVCCDRFQLAALPDVGRGPLRGREDRRGAPRVRPGGLPVVRTDRVGLPADLHAASGGDRGARQPGACAAAEVGRPADRQYRRDRDHGR
jgi:acyl-CoA synthetase (AMP-forming)/AMP-acid ligase II